MARQRKTGLYIEADDSTFIQWLEKFENWDSVILDEFGKAAVTLENHAKNYAPWEDRTGDARRHLSAEAEMIDDNPTITLSHGVEYGKWLELIQNGRFAILEPTMRALAPMMMGQAAKRIREYMR